MEPQYVATDRSGESGFEALESQTNRLKCSAYVFVKLCSMVPVGHTQVFLTSVTGRARQYKTARSTHIDRRHRCQRASNSWQPSVSSPLYLHVQAARRKKNTLWLHPSPSRLSQHTQASTSKLAPGQTFAPVPTPTSHTNRTRMAPVVPFFISCPLRPHHWRAV